MAPPISRRQFLQLAALSAAGLAFRSVPGQPPDEQPNLGRVTVDWIGLYGEPSFRAKNLARLTRDQLVTIQERVQSDAGPGHNPLWYRLADGYAHSGYLQLVRWLPQTPLSLLPDSGALFEVSVPFTRTYRQADPTTDPLYRLYYQATAWVDAVVTGSDGRPWYRLMDDLLHLHYFARAEHLRWIAPDELTPISPEVPLGAKRIEVSIARQELTAYEHNQVVLQTKIASGLPELGRLDHGIPTDTPKGLFWIDKKMPLRHMGDGHLTASLEAYELPGVPWVSFFHSTGIAFHGTYWHNDFGRPKSHGCVNMRTEEAKWLYRWSMPETTAAELLKIGRGTLVEIS
jgi:hypothetical protein